MQIVRTVIWVLLLVGLLLFSVANWDPTVTVRIWEGIVVDTKIPAIVIVSFLIGFVPMWLYYRGSRWKMQRKIASLENAARTAAVTPVAAHDSDGDGIPDRTDPHPHTQDTATTATTVTTAPRDGVEGTHVPTASDKDGDGVPDAVEDDRLSPSPASTSAPGTYRAPGE